MDEVDISILPQPELDFGGAEKAADALNNGAGNVLLTFADKRAAA